MPMLDASVPGLLNLFNPTAGIYMVLGVLWGMLVGILLVPGDIIGAVALTLTLPLMLALMLALGPRRTS